MPTWPSINMVIPLDDREGEKLKRLHVCIDEDHFLEWDVLFLKRFSTLRKT